MGNAPQASSGRDRTPRADVDAHGRRIELDQYHPSAPSFYNGMRSEEQSTSDLYSGGMSIRPSSLPGIQSTQLAQRQAFPNEGFDAQRSARPAPSSIAQPLRGHSAIEPSIYGLGRHIPPEGLQSGAGSLNGSAVRCLNCDKRETPEWRKGPYGPRTLCNACVSSRRPPLGVRLLTSSPLIQGLVWAKIQKRRAKEASGSTKPIPAAIGKVPLLILDDRRNMPTL
jgi:hypothetical protein